MVTLPRSVHWVIITIKITTVKINIFNLDHRSLFNVNLSNKDDYAHSNVSDNILSVDNNDVHVQRFTSDSVYDLFKDSCGIKFLHINTQSLCPKLEELKYMSQDLNLDCISINETWLNTSFSDAEKTEQMPPMVVSPSMCVLLCIQL